MKKTSTAKRNGKWTAAPFPEDVRGIIVGKTKKGNIVENSDGVRFETMGTAGGEYFYRKYNK